MNERLHNYVEITDIKDMLNKSVEKFSNRPVFKFKIGNSLNYREITYKELFEDVNSFGTSLINLGLKSKRIAIIGENRYEWAVSYLAIVCGAGIVIPIDTSLDEIEIRNLIVDYKIEAIIYTSEYDKIITEIKKNNILLNFISMDLEKSENHNLSFKELIDNGKKMLKNGDKKFIDNKIDNQEMSIILKSRNTKSVVLSHKNICCNLMDIASVIEIHEEDILLSVLPLHQAFEITIGFLYPIYKGACITFCNKIECIENNIKNNNVSVMIGMPVIYEKIYKKIITSIVKKRELGKFELLKKISNLLLFLHIDIRKKIFKEIHENFGGNIRLFICGGDFFDLEAEKVFYSLGIKIIKGYGLTEASPVVSFENDKYSRIGSVGKVLPSLDLKIDNPNSKGIGEILVKGDSIMLEYFENKNDTEKVLKSGWLYTGDLGHFDQDNFLFIDKKRHDFTKQEKR